VIDDDEERFGNLVRYWWARSDEDRRVFAGKDLGQKKAVDAGVDVPQDATGIVEPRNLRRAGEARRRREEHECAVGIAHSNWFGVVPRPEESSIDVGVVAERRCGS
jgi:hypothetical protein